MGRIIATVIWVLLVFSACQGLGFGQILTPDLITVTPPKVSRGNLQNLIIPTSYTGTQYPEQIEYQIPTSYNGAALPLLVCWHRYEHTCFEVSATSKIPEECEARGIIFLSITGSNQVHFGNLIAQHHCTRAIDYLREEILDPFGNMGVNVDLDRIYMAGCSMGGGAAMSYACRHLSHENGYQTAGLVVIIPILDLSDAYNKGDPGVVKWAPYFLNNSTPCSEPFLWRQISGVFIENAKVNPDQSMGRNLCHNIPIYQTYAANDFKHLNLIWQNQVLGAYLKAQGANTIFDGGGFFPKPHSWSILNLKKSFDFLEKHSLKDRTTESISVIMDECGPFFWIRDFTKKIQKEFSIVKAETDPKTNALSLSKGANLDGLSLDFEASKLQETLELRVKVQVSNPWPLTLDLSPIRSPTYMVDSQGVLLTMADYNPITEKITFDIEPSAQLNAKVSFEAYELSLTPSSNKVKLGSNYQLSLEGGKGQDLFLLFFCLTQKETQINPLQHLLIDPGAARFVLSGNLNSAGQIRLPCQAPPSASFNQRFLYLQALTYQTSLERISNLLKLEFY